MPLFLESGSKSLTQMPQFSIKNTDGEQPDLPEYSMCFYSRKKM